MNEIISFIASFEQFLFKEIPLRITTMLVLYILISVLFRWIEKPSFSRLTMVCFGILLFQSTAIWAKINSATSTELIVFHQRNETLMAKRTDSGITFLSSEKDQKRLVENYLVKSFLLENGNPKRKFLKLDNVIFFQNKKVLVIDSLSVYPETVPSDILILSNSPKINLERFLQQQKPSIIIADGSNYKSYVSRWNETCQKQKIPFHATYEKGFYKIE